MFVENWPLVPPSAPIQEIQVIRSIWINFNKSSNWRFHQRLVWWLEETHLKDVEAEMEFNEFDADEFTPLEYARFRGLAIDHLAEPLPDLFDVGQGIFSILEDLDDSRLLQIELPPGFRTDERLTLNKDAAQILASATSNAAKTTDIEAITLQLLDVRSVRKLRVEEPLLRSDHEADCRELPRRERAQFENMFFPMEELDDEKDEGLGWPSEMIALPATLIKNFQQEKIEVSKETLLYLQSTLQESWTKADQVSLWDEVNRFQRNPKNEPVTPPLLPQTPPYIPFEFSSPDGYLPLLSDPESLSKGDLESIESQIFQHEHLFLPVMTETGHSSSDTLKDDSFTPPQNGLSNNIFSPSAYINDTTPPSLPRIRIKDHKVEVPLMPSVFVKKMVSFDPNVEEMLLDEWRTNADTPSILEPYGMEDPVFDMAFGEAAEVANRMLRQERLVEADSTRRVDVPKIGFDLPASPWKYFQQLEKLKLEIEQKRLVADLLSTYGKPKIWPGVQKIQHLMKWSPFSSELGKVALEEDFGSVIEVNKYLQSEQPDEIINSSWITWKPEALRIIKDEEDDDDEHEDLLPWSFTDFETLDIISLAMKRKTKLEKELKALKPFHRPFVLSPKPIGPGKTTERAGTPSITKSPLSKSHDSTTASLLLEDSTVGGSDILMDGNFSAANALSNFLLIRGSKRQKLTDSSYFTDLSKGLQQPGTERVQELPSFSPSLAPKPLPVPIFSASQVPSPIIISSTLHKHRTLMRTLRATMTNHLFIERDFTAHNTTIWQPGSVSRSPVVSPLAEEADIIVSPSTGLILTTLMKIKQKPLPGQKAKAAIRERIENASVRYERLIVLVSEGVHDEESSASLDEASSLALCEFIGFCGSLETRILPFYIAGSETTLAKWISGMICQYGVPGEELLEDVTLWELFLRRIGLNAYAAQTVLAMLKAPEGMNTESPSKVGLFGLVGFVELGRREVLRRFGEVLGGERVLMRVMDVLEQRWDQ